MTPPPSARSSGVVVAICSAVDACQHAVGQDVVGRDERGEVGDAQPPRPCPCPGSAAGGCCPRRCRPTRTSTSTRSRSSRPVAPARRRARNCWSATPAARRVDLLHHETRRRRVGRRGCHHLPPAAVKGREPAGWRWASLAEQQPVDPPGVVEPAAGASPSDPRRVRCRAREPPEPGQSSPTPGRRRVRALADGGGEVPLGEDADQMLAPKTGKVPTWCQFMRSAASSRASSAWAVTARVDPGRKPY